MVGLMLSTSPPVSGVCPQLCEDLVEQKDPSTSSNMSTKQSAEAHYKLFLQVSRYLHPTEASRVAGAIIVPAANGAVTNRIVDRKTIVVYKPYLPSSFEHNQQRWELYGAVRCNETD